MNIQPDFEELLRLFEENEVEYLIVGGFAVAFHGYPRFTKDIDLFISAADNNIIKLRQALLNFGFNPNDIPFDLFQKPGNIIAFGMEPTRVDILTEIDGVEFTTAWMNKVRGTYGSIEVNFIGRSDLIRNKKATTRLQDKADAEYLSGNT